MPTKAAAASPGPLDSEKKWKQWEERFINYLNVHIGTFGIPLSYVIRDQAKPDRTMKHPDFVAHTIKRAPLKGPYYDADKQSVFQMLVSFTSGHPSGDWIKPTLKFSDGRKSWLALQAHFAGEGTRTSSLAEGKRLSESLHYKSERAMNFETFLNKCQQMFNIFEKYGDPMSDEAKVRFLFKKVEHPGMQLAIEALRAEQSGGRIVTYQRAASHLTTTLSTIPQAAGLSRRNIAAVHISEEGPSSASILNLDGSIITGYHPNWQNLSKLDREKIKAARKAKKGGGTKSKTAAEVNTLRQLKEANAEYRRKIKALKRKTKTAIAASDDEASDDDVNVADEFGGRNSKKKKNE